MRWLGILLLGVISACGNNSAEDNKDYSQQGKPAYGDIYVEATLGGATNLVPWLAGESSASAITGHIYNSILKYDKNLNLVGDLAKSWQVSNGGKTIIFTLKQGVKWHDGKPFTTADVKATFNAITNPNTRTPYAGDFLLVKKFTVLSPFKFKVEYAKPFAPALSSWSGLAILPAHILKLDADVNKTRLKKHPVGTGAYVLESWNPQTETVLKANPDYFEGKPYIEKIRIRTIPDQDTQFLELKAGRIDTMGLKPVQYVRLTNKNSFTKRYAKYKYLGFGYTYLGFNLKKDLFKNKLVRQALSYATPRTALVKGILHNQGEAITSVFKPGTWAYNSKLKPYEFNLKKAKKLMAKAGWEDTNHDGILDKNGKPFKFTIITNQGNDQRIKTAEILQQTYKQIGVGVQIQVQEWRTFLENTLYPRNFEAFILGWSLSPEPDPYDIWHSSKQGKREFNIIGFENPKADKLMTQARQTFNQAKRKKLLDEFQKILHEEQPTLLLYAPYSLTAIHKRFKGIAPAPAGIGYNFYKWFVPTNQQKYKVVVTP